MQPEAVVPGHHKDLDPAPDGCIQIQKLLSLPLYKCSMHFRCNCTTNSRGRIERLLLRGQDTELWEGKKKHISGSIFQNKLLSFRKDKIALVRASVPEAGKYRVVEALLPLHSVYRTVSTELVMFRTRHMVPGVGFEYCWMPARFGSRLPLLEMLWGFFL